jgi:hypothetical protein
VVAGVALVAVAAVVTVAFAGSGGSGGGAEVVARNARRSVIAALNTTNAARSYQVAFTLRATPPTRPQRCATVPLPPGVVTGSGGAPRFVCAGVMAPVDVNGHATVNEDPYALAVVSNVSTLGPITLYVNSTTLWELGGGNYGSTPNAPAAVGPGSPLSGFLSLVTGTFGPGPGALIAINLANPNGYLNLAQQAIEHAAPAGSGTADGTPVTYYDVSVDVAQLAHGANLTDQQHITIDDAARVLKKAGYVGTKQRMGIDGAGFVREINSTATFTDGSALIRHTTFSNFGCAPTISMPNQPAVPTTTAVPCSTPDTVPNTSTPTTSTSASSTTTSSAPTTTTTEPPTTTTS